MATGKKLTWKQRLLRARTNHVFTNEDQHDAGKWASCAIGELKNIRRGYFKQPISRVYDDLGMQFFHAVRANTPFQATLIYNDIRNHYKRSRRSK